MRVWLLLLSRGLGTTGGADSPRNRQAGESAVERRHPNQRSPLATAWRQLDLALDEFIDHQLRAA
jgi:hypothetical protein